MKRLGIISDCIHVRDSQGRIGSTNHVFVMQMNALASHFSKTIFCTPVIDQGQDTPTLSYYTHQGIEFQPLPQAGGKSWSDKLHLITMIPRWFKEFSILDKKVDIFYQRFPNNLNIPGFLYAFFKRKPCFATYTGTWGAYESESITYKFQRYLLTYLYRGPVFVYDFTIKHKRIFPSISPSYSLQEWRAETNAVDNKVATIQKRAQDEPIHLMSVGSLIDYKNHLFLLQACVLLKKANRQFKLHIAGNGILKNEINAFIESNNLQDAVTLLGVIPQDELRNYYRTADFVIQPSIIEGYGKVPVEAMFHGAVPLLSPVSNHPFFIGKNNERGAIFTLNDASSIVAAIDTFVNNPSFWVSAVRNGREFSKDFTMEHWTQSLIDGLINKGIYS